MVLLTPTLQKLTALLAASYTFPADAAIVPGHRPMIKARQADTAQPLPTCEFLAQYQLGLCTGGVAPTDSSTVVDTSLLPSQATVVYIPTVQDGVSKTLAVIKGGPITSFVTLPDPAPTKLDPTGDIVQSSISAISQDMAGALPLVSSWVQAPDPPKATAAIQTVEVVIPKVVGLINGLPGGEAGLQCPAQNAKRAAPFLRRDAASELLDKLRKLACDALGLLDGLQAGQGTQDPADPAVSGVLADSSGVNSDLAGIVATVTGGSPPTTSSIEVVPPQTSTTDIVPPPVTTEETTSPAPPPATITTLPPGASLVTLSTGTFVSDVYITTTSEGSNEPTIVPVIIPPGGGPPIICFGCFGSFPPNIVVNITGPEGFCVQFLGLKIGNCPTDQSPTEGPTQAPTTEGPSPTTDSESPTSSTSPCSATITATFKSVFCTVTGDAGAVARRQEGQGCSTLEYSTVTGDCSLTPSATTTTTTVRPTHVGCSPDNIGCGGACRRAVEIAKRAAPPRSSEPGAGKMAGPENYGDNIQNFMRGEIGRAAQRQTGKLVQLVGNQATSEMIQFKDQVDALGIAGLYGCTAIVAVSEQGAWVSHFWEVPAFTHDVNIPLDPVLQGDQFQRDVIDAMKKGRAGDATHAFGLSDLRGNEADLTNGDTFDDLNNPRIFIMVPRKRVPYFDQNGQAQPDAVVTGEQAGEALGLAYDVFVRKIETEIQTIFGQGINMERIEYSPLVPTLAQVTDPAINVLPALQDVGFDTHRGKLLLQYEPAAPAANPGECTTDKSKWRVWFEGQPLGDRHAEFDRVDLFLNIPRDLEAGNDTSNVVRKQRRQAPACTLNPTASSAPGTTGAEGPTQTVDPTATVTSAPTASPPTPTNGSPCAADGDCAAVACAPGANGPASCLLSACRCLFSTLTLGPAAPTPTVGQGCSVDGDCNGLVCGTSEHPSCLQFSPGVGSTCQCYPN